MRIKNIKLWPKRHLPSLRIQSLLIAFVPYRRHRIRCKRSVVAHIKDVPWPLSSKRLGYAKYPNLDHQDEEVARPGIPLICFEPFWPCWPAYDLFRKTGQGCPFSDCDMGRSFRPHNGAHPPLSEYPACDWAGVAEAMADLRAHHSLPQCSPCDWTAYAACYWSMVVR